MESDEDVYEDEGDIYKKSRREVMLDDDEINDVDDGVMQGFEDAYEEDED